MADLAQPLISKVTIGTNTDNPWCTKNSKRVESKKETLLLYRQTKETSLCMGEVSRHEGSLFNCRRHCRGFVFALRFTETVKGEPQKVLASN